MAQPPRKNWPVRLCYRWLTWTSSIVHAVDSANVIFKWTWKLSVSVCSTFLHSTAMTCIAFGNYCLHSIGTILSGMWRNSQTRRHILRRQCCPWTSRLHQQSSWWLWYTARFRIFTFCKSVVLWHTARFRIFTFCKSVIIYHTKNCQSALL